MTIVAHVVGTTPCGGPVRDRPWRKENLNTDTFIINITKLMDDGIHAQMAICNSGTKRKTCAKLQTKRVRGGGVRSPFCRAGGTVKQN
jgi:hypothetical protein